MSSLGDRRRGTVGRPAGGVYQKPVSDVGFFLRCDVYCFSLKNEIESMCLSLSIWTSMAVRGLERQATYIS